MKSVVKMMTMILFYLITLLLITNKTQHPPPFVACSASSMRCQRKESSALHSFVNSLTVKNSGMTCDILSWKKGTDCCDWCGIKCDDTSPHHVVELYLFGVVGNLESNNSLFQLTHLRVLVLSNNDFRQSPLSTKFVSSFPYLEHLDLSSSNFSGEIPLEISNLSELSYLDLSDNNDLKMKKSTFYGFISNSTKLINLNLRGVSINSTIPPSFTNLSSLTHLDLRGCNLVGELPNLINLPHLERLYLGENGGLHANFPLSNWSTSLGKLDLSSITFSSKLSSFYAKPQQSPIGLLLLYGCNLYGHFSNWFRNVTMDPVIDNYTIGFSNYRMESKKVPIPSIEWVSSPVELDLSHNMFYGPLPVLPDGIGSFHASDNNFTGHIHSSYCNLNLYFLDLSNNKLEGELPPCFSDLISKQLYVLNLGNNSIFGIIPNISKIFSCENIKFLDLSYNFFRGLLPLWLSNCTIVEVLNLSGNKFKGKFPHLFGYNSKIQVLDLSHNKFYGHLPDLDASNQFSKLQILDISNNHFYGKISVGFIENCKAMMDTSLGMRGLEYMGSGGYFYSITLTFNGLKLKYTKIITSLATFDLSNNEFEGDIPHNIGKLVSIHGLNLSHNLLIGHIPKSLGNLILLNSLDLSYNKLSGQIPQELRSLSSLGVFDVSYNQLEGPIPIDNHFETFPMKYFEGNVRLCGFPLPDCGEHNEPSPKQSRNDDEDEDVGMIMPEWKVIMMGCGFGTFVWFAWGCYMLSIGRPLWLLNFVLFLVDQIEKLIGRRRKGARRN